LLDVNDECEEDIVPNYVEMFFSIKSGTASQDDSYGSRFVSVQKHREEPETYVGWQSIVILRGQHIKTHFKEPKKSELVL
jgi:hypothetical protein